MGTTIVALAGVIGTLLAPILGERVKRQSAREDRRYDRQLTLYADLMRATVRITDNAQNWSAIPLADLAEPDDELLDRTLAQVRVLASDQVRDQMLSFQHAVSAFRRHLFEARLLHRRVREAGDGDSGEAIQSRVQLGGLADEVVGSFKRLEAAVRQEALG